MEPDERNMLQRSVKLSEENNQILRKMIRAARWNTVFRVVYWLFIIGAGLGLYYYIEPYAKEIFSVYGGFKSTLTQFGNIFSGTSTPQ